MPALVAGIYVFLGALLRIWHSPAPVVVAEGIGRPHVASERVHALMAADIRHLEEIDRLCCSGGQKSGRYAVRLIASRDSCVLRNPRRLQKEETVSHCPRIRIMTVRGQGCPRIPNEVCGVLFSPALSPLVFSAALKRRSRSIAFENIDRICQQTLIVAAKPANGAVEPLAETVDGVGGALTVSADRTQKKASDSDLID
jgi:hypothetical protein